MTPPPMKTKTWSGQTKAFVIAVAVAARIAADVPPLPLTLPSIEATSVRVGGGGIPTLGAGRFQRNLALRKRVHHVAVDASTPFDAPSQEELKEGAVASDSAVGFQPVQPPPRPTRPSRPGQQGGHQVSFKFGTDKCADGPSCGENAGDCWCDDLCRGYGDCCDDACQACACQVCNEQPGECSDSTCEDGDGFCGSPPAPDAPTNLAVSQVSDPQVGVELTWSAASTGGQATGFTVHRSTDTDSFSQIGQVSDGTTTTYVDTSSLEPGTYFYAVRASNDGGVSDFSNDVSVTITESPSSGPSSAPSSLPSEFPSLTPSQQPSRSGAPSAVQSSDPSSVPSPEPSGWPSEAPSSGPSVTPDPHAPEDLSVTLIDGVVDLSWTEPLAGTSPSGYNVYRRMAGKNYGSEALVTVDGASTTAYTDADLPGPGTYHYAVKAISSVGGEGEFSNEDSVTWTPPCTDQMAVYDGVMGAPACLTAGCSCDTGTSLVDDVGSGESNQPNTLDGCADGDSGSYHADESIDRLVVETVGGGVFAEGVEVEVRATVYAYSIFSGDSADFYHAADVDANAANDPSWNLMGTVVPTKGGINILTHRYTLPAGALQAVRINFRWSGSAIPCTTGNYDDRDDLVFAIAPPQEESECSTNEDCPGISVCEDGGVCSSSSPSSSPSRSPGGSPYDITVDSKKSGSYVGDWREFLAPAAARWEDIIAEDLPSASRPNFIPAELDCDAGMPAEIDDMYICAKDASLDGPSGTLAVGGLYFNHLRDDETSLPFAGYVQLDSNDIDYMISTNDKYKTLETILLHEIGHALGIGIIWDDKGLEQNGRFTGANACAEWSAHGCPGCPPIVPGHWAENAFGKELMSPTINLDASNPVYPISRVTLASMQDIGYTVDMSEADDFTPSSCARRLDEEEGEGDRFFSRGEKTIIGGRRRLSPEGHASAVDFGKKFMTRANGSAAVNTFGGGKEGEKPMLRQVSVVYAEEDEAGDVLISSVLVRLGD